MAEAGRERSKMGCGNAAMGVVAMRKNTQVKRMTPFLDDVLAVSEAKRSWSGYELAKGRTPSIILPIPRTLWMVLHSSFKFYFGGASAAMLYEVTGC